MPEGPSREQRRRQRREHAQRAQLVAAVAQDRAAAEAAMQQALHGEARWGMGVDAEVEGGDEEGGDIEWRPRFEAGLLTPKQMKTAEAIRSKEYKLQARSSAPRTMSCAPACNAHAIQSHLPICVFMAVLCPATKPET